MFNTILVAVDGTLTSNRGLAVAIGLAKEQRAVLHVLHVFDELVTAPMLYGAGAADLGYVNGMLETLGTSGRRIIASAEKAASRSVASVHAEMVKSHGQPVAVAILRYAKRVHADLIVLGTHGRRGVRRLVMGSDAEAVVREARVPVLLVRSATIAPGGTRAKAVPRSGTAVRATAKRVPRPSTPRPVR